MAEPNGERLKARFGQHALGITTRDLIPVLLIIMMAMGGYLIFNNTRWALQSIFNRQQLILNRLDSQDEKLAFQTREFTRLIAIHEFNQDRKPEERLPLEIDSTWLPRPVTPEIPVRRDRKPEQ